MNRLQAMSAWMCVVGLGLLVFGCTGATSVDGADSGDASVADSVHVDVYVAESDTSEGESDVVDRALDVVGGELDSIVGELDVTEGAPDVTEAQTDESAVPFLSLSDEADVVGYVEVDRYMGLWYEIATTPSFQQGSCFSTQAQYSFNEDKGWVDVVNSCRIGSTLGNWQQIQGRAELVDLETQAKLNVIFFGQISPYWVVALDGTEGEAPYQWAVVSVPSKQSMWILSRSKQLTQEQREAIDAHLVARDFPVETLIDTPHGD